MTDEPDDKPPNNVILRTPHGRFQRGASANPGGQGRNHELKQMARTHTADAVKTLAAIMNNEDARDQDRILAANSLLDRGHGRPGAVDEAGMVREEMQRLSVQVLQVIADRPRTLELDAPDEPEDTE